jgi:serine/threonine protein phosphatase 1
MKRFVIGDIHGANKALVQCLERSGFNKSEDQLIVLGDICDGWDEVYECVETLLTIKNRIDILGNHDDWFRFWLNTGTHPFYWTQGGVGTAKSYLRQIDKDGLIVRSGGRGGYLVALNPDDVPPTHWKFFHHMNLYYHDQERNDFFVHAGFDRHSPVVEQRRYNAEVFLWDRKLWAAALSCHNVKLTTADGFRRIFIGHTSCYSHKRRRGLPVASGGVINLDTGAGWEGKLTIMQIDTLRYWQSDLVTELYPEQTTRR